MGHIGCGRARAALSTQILLDHPAQRGPGLAAGSAAAAVPAARGLQAEAAGGAGRPGGDGLGGDDRPEEAGVHHEPGGLPPLPPLLRQLQKSRSVAHK